MGGARVLRRDSSDHAPSTVDGIPLPPGADLVSLMGVSYARLRTADGGDLYVVGHGLPFLGHLRPESWYETAWFEAHRVRLPGTSCVYAVPTKEVCGRSIDLVVKYSRVGQFVPLETQVIHAALLADFNSPFEEFALVEEARRDIDRRRLPIRFQEPLAILVPPERMQLWQSGRSEARIAGKLARHAGIEIDILRDYLVVYRWLEGIDAVAAFDRGLLDHDGLEALTRRAEGELADLGFRVLDMKPNHVIVRTGSEGGLRRVATSADVEYGLVDHELLQRTPEREADVGARRQREYQDGGRAGDLPSQIEPVSILGVEYVSGRVESTGGTLWVRRRDARLFEYFLPERWRQTPRIRLHPAHETFATRSKDNVDLVWKVSRVGEPADVDDGSVDARALAHGVNSPFEEVALAVRLEDAGVPVISAHAIYRTGHASRREDRTLDWRRYRTHGSLRAPDGEPILRTEHDYVTLWRYGGGPVLGDETEVYYGAVNLAEAGARGWLMEAESRAVLDALAGRIRASGVEALDLRARQVLLALDPQGKLRRGEDGAPMARLCSFDFLKLPTSTPAEPEAGEGFVPPGALGFANTAGRARLHELVAMHEGALVERTLRRVLASGAPHYRDRAGEDARARIQGLASAILRATRGNRTALLKHVRRILEQRLDEGFRLNEIQMALGCFEEEIWRLCEAEVRDREDLIACLGTASGLVGEAKDELARLYLENRPSAGE